MNEVQSHHEFVILRVVLFVGSLRCHSLLLELLPEFVDQIGCVVKCNMVLEETCLVEALDQFDICKVLRISLVLLAVFTIRLISSAAFPAFILFSLLRSSFHPDLLNRFLEHLPQLAVFIGGHLDAEGLHARLQLYLSDITVAIHVQSREKVEGRHLLRLQTLVQLLQKVLLTLQSVTRLLVYSVLQVL